MIEKKKNSKNAFAYTSRNLYIYETNSIRAARKKNDATQI